MIIFYGEDFDSVGPGTVRIEENGVDKGELPPRHDLRNHSPDGFQAGYMGSGPAQLSLALLAYVLDDDAAMTYYKRFKSTVVGHMDEDAWALTDQTIEDWYEHQESLR